ncbi:MAG: tripartite tricarboxylate transporter TctB family protein [Hyphomicrobiaceae bacterium]
MMTNKNLIAGLVFLAFGLLSLTVLIPYGVQQPQSVKYQALSPSYWPNIVCTAISAIGMALIVAALISGRSGSAAAATSEANQPSPSGWHAFRPFIALAICFASYLALEPLGFVLTTAIALAALMLLAGEFRPHILLPVSVLVPLGLHVFFTKAASVPIPAGILEPVLLRI